MKPILFNSDMVRAIQNGIKTVTRRVVKFPKGWNPQWSGYVADGAVLYGSNNIPAVKAPYQPGDILYVRETWAIIGTDGTHNDYGYKADGINYGVLWHPSIHMPKEAARIFLRVTDVRVERLKDITEEQARAEGFGSRAEFIKTFLAMYPDCTEESWVWVIEFEKITKEEALKA